MMARPLFRKFSKRPYKRALVVQPRSLSPTGRLRLARMIHAARSNGNAVRTVQWANGEVGLYSRKRYNHTNVKRQKVLIGCEASGIVRDAFINAGHDAWSCDIDPAYPPTPTQKRHIQRDVIRVLGDEDWDIAIFHPPCTYLSASGLHWNTRPGYEDRQQKTEDALEFVRQLLDADVDQICLENPVGCISTKIRKPDQYIQPHDFGHDASKKTGLWLKDLPELETTAHVKPRMVGGLPRWSNQADCGGNILWPSSERSRLRAETYRGIASAMAAQWGVPENYVDYGVPQPFGFGNYGPTEVVNVFSGLGVPEARQKAAGKT